MTTNFGVWSTPNQRRFEEVFPWIAALDAFDYGDRQPLRELMASTEPVPDELRPALANIVAGIRRSNGRAAVKTKVPAARRLKVAVSLSVLLGLNDTFKFEDIYDNGEIRRALEVMADRSRSEPIDELRILEAEGRALIEGAAARHGVSVETIENLLRDLRRKMREFPDV